MFLTRFLPTRLFLGLASAFLLWQGAIFLRPAPTPCSVPQQRALEAAVNAAVKTLAETVEPPVTVAVAQLANDPTRTATDILKQTIAGQEGWTIEEKSLVRKFLADVTQAAANATSLNEIMFAGRRVNVDLILSGAITKNTQLPDGARAELFLRAYDTRHGHWLWRRLFTAEWHPSLLEKLGDPIRQLPRWLRIILWAALVLLPPWLTRPLTRQILDQQSNTASILLLIGYTLANLVAAWILAGFSLAPFFPIWRGLIIILLCAAYNYAVCETIAARIERPR